jgi:hypothetical protein
MSHDYAPLPSDGFELRRRAQSHVADGVGEGFSLYAVSTEPQPAAWKLGVMLRRISACARSKWGAAVLVVVLLAGACVAYSWTRTALDDDAGERAVNHVRGERAASRARLIYVALQVIYKDAQADECMKSLDVLWQLPVGCDFSGFFVEVLTLIEPLVRIFDFRLDIGSCSDTMLKVLTPPHNRNAVSRVL